MKDYREVSSLEGIRLANKFGCAFFETRFEQSMKTDTVSAMTAFNVEQAFEAAACLAIVDTYLQNADGKSEKPAVKRKNKKENCSVM